ncbi:MAG TPA: alpha/beta hydrolase domain-containing protein [Mycobacterium sp.]|nr:alpha/beta hydrolase domain-containing protein [Mycobacterium sp.]HME46986.1 alpha/beta hydrolase domain-containing protein [Mycobacterium sp.]
MTDHVVVTPAPGKPNLLLGAFDIAGLGFLAEEFFVSGTASSYAPGAELGADGRWTVTHSGTADYTTRMVVLTPADRARFNGTVLVEWLNVSGGIDAPAVWFMAHREVVRAGYAYVAVSAQRVGVEGGVSRGGADMSLKTQDPVRYASLRHPGDAFSYDMFSRIGGLIRDAQHSGVLGSLTPKHVVAVGESQSAFFLTTYVNAIDPLAGVYDGFLIHSRFAPAAPLDGSSIFGADRPAMPQAVRFRPDLRVPLITIITETDLFGGPQLGYHHARQPDDERLRTWEIPGTAHADNYTIQVAPIDTGFAPLDDIVAAYAPTRILMGRQLAHAINFAPQHHYVLQAALARLCNWVRTGEPAPRAPRIQCNDADPPGPVLDPNGLSRGGVRTPWVDVPVARTSGFGTDESALSDLFGSGELFDARSLRRLYPGGVADYLERFTAALDRAIQSGFIVAADRPEILRIAAATYPRGQ